MDELVRYFAAEKAESALFVAMGIVAIGLSAYLWLQDSPYRAIALPFILIGLIQVAVGGSVFLRTNRQVAALQAQLAQSPEAMQHAELPRMQTVLRNFRLYKGIELLVLLGGLAAALVIGPNNARFHPHLYAIAAGCIVQGAVMLALDLFAEARGHIYITWLEKLLL